MLSYSSINDAWALPTKQNKSERKTPKKIGNENNHELTVAPTFSKNETQSLSTPEFGNIQEPYVLRISDAELIKKLNIYNPQYIYGVIIDVLKDHFDLKRVNVQTDVNAKKEENELVEEGFINTENIFDDEFKEILCIFIAFAVLLLTIDILRKIKF